MTRREFLAQTGAALAATVLSARGAAPETRQADVCVYGGTASGIIAAVSAAQEGRRVLVIEPGRWLGGMTGGGINRIDWGRKEAVGGLASSILKDALDDAHYRRVFQELVREHNVTVVYEHRLASAQREGKRIKSIVLDHAPPDRRGCPAPTPQRAAAMTVAARVFIDCSYEGDLMARAGVSYTWGRESRDEYDESLAGVRLPLLTYDIDPYRRPGDPASGLIPLLQATQMGPLGSADRRMMGYGFRWKFQAGPDALPIVPPDDYDPWTFELYRRGFKAGVKMEEGRQMRTLGKYEPSPGEMYRLVNGNISRSLWSPAIFGCTDEYPDGDWKARSRIWRFHQDFFAGITHFLRTDPSVPEVHRQRAATMGFKPGQFDDTGGWPHQLYVREARRMKSAYVVTQKDLEGRTDPADSVGLASYGVDDFPYAMNVVDGKVALQGGEFSILYLDDRHRGIYKIPYRTITPQARECDNLLVPVCCSASHLAMTSLRMEPVWMTLGQSAGVAAALASRQDIAVQAVDYAKLRSRLQDLGVKLERPGAN